MINISNYLDKTPSLENRNSAFFFEILNKVINSNCSDCLNLNNTDLYECYNNQKAEYIESIFDTIAAKPILYSNNEQLNPNIQVKFTTKEISYIPVKFFSKRIDRNLLKISNIENVHGVNQFFMDHDLTSGYVHTYTQNFYDILNDDGFVLCFRRSKNRINEAMAFYKRKKDLCVDDILGENFAFCRQWKLSEIDLKENKILLKKCNYGPKKCNCLQVKSNSDNPYSPEIPLWSSNTKEGYVEISKLNGLAIMMEEQQQLYGKKKIMKFYLKMYMAQLMTLLL